MSSFAVPPTTLPNTQAGDGPLRRDLALDLLRCKWRAEEVSHAVPKTEVAGSRVVRVFEENVEVLRTIMGEHGWPGYVLVGEKAAQVAWHIAYYCPDAAFQNDALCLLEAAVRSRGANPEHYALLADRLCVMRHEPQRFGTQYLSDDAGGITLYPVAELRRLDDRRSAWGLEPHAEYDARIRDDITVVGSVGPRRP
ncbi:DUF6624 domain-containing protein [Streptomyces sp. NBC_01615]|uniref:DUF6624 domain-containing protein n=1 Tax=Streptomyces sp. NBC_01615 TaxID=2975898 RepID=UPI003866CFC2